MATSLAPVGRHALREGSPYLGMLGERPGLRGDFGLGPIDAAADPSAPFSYGQYFDSWSDVDALPRQEAHVYGTVTGRQVTAFLGAANEVASQMRDARRAQLWNNRAHEAVQAIQDVIDSPEETELVVFSAPYEEWAKDDQIIPAFVGWIQQMAHAYDEPGEEQAHIERDDFNDEYPDPTSHGTIIRLGDGLIPVFVIEESAIRYGDDGSRGLWRQVSLAKIYSPEGAVHLLNRLSLTEKERLARMLDDPRLLDSPELAATNEEKAYVLHHADRASVQDDSSARAWVEWYRNPPPPERWRAVKRAGRAIAGLWARLESRVQPAMEESTNLT